jgi:hypothetical protein
LRLCGILQRMVARNRSTQRPTDPIYRRLLANMDAAPLRKEAKVRRDEWATRGLKLSEAGQVKEAEVAARKAEFWDRRLKKLEHSVD